MTSEQDLLQQSSEEIKSLRSQNNSMAARLDMFDKCMVLLHTAPAYQGQGMGEDLVYKIEKQLASIKSEQTKDNG